MSNLSRRTLVTSAAALPALAVPALASAAPDDLIYAAIKKSRNSFAAFIARCHYEDHLNESGDENGNCCRRPATIERRRWWRS